MLQAFGFGSPGSKGADFGADTVMKLGHPPRRIDLLTTLDGVSFEACWQRREQVRIDGLTIQRIGLTDFMTNKRATGRLEDLADLEALDPPDPCQESP